MFYFASLASHASHASHATASLQAAGSNRRRICSTAESRWSCVESLHRWNAPRHTAASAWDIIRANFSAAPLSAPATKRTIAPPRASGVPVPASSSPPGSAAPPCSAASSVDVAAVARGAGGAALKTTCSGEMSTDRAFASGSGRVALCGTSVICVVRRELQTKAHGFGQVGLPREGRYWYCVRGQGRETERDSMCVLVSEMSRVSL